MQDEDDPSASLNAGSTPAIKLIGTSCCLLGSNNWLRLKLAQLVAHKQFENVILVLIFLSSISIALQMPSLDRNGVMYIVLEYLDMVFVVLFAVEALLKILVCGFIANGPGSYLRSGWNMLDFLIVVLGEPWWLHAGHARALRNLEGGSPGAWGT